MKKSILAVALIATFSAGAPVWAETKAALTPEQAQTTQKAIEQEQNKQNELLQKVNAGVKEGLDHVLKAVELLGEEKDADALSELQAAAGKFSTALAANPDLGMVPVDGYVTIHELITTPTTIKKTLDEVDDLLDDGKVQDARILLSTLRDEMEIATVFLPMATYPDAIDLAAKYLVDGKRDRALEVLDTAASSLVTEVTTVPLGLIRAKSLIKKASEQDKTDKAAALILVNAAREQLRVSEVLGYTNEKSESYRKLNKKIDQLEKEINGKNAVEKLYDELATAFSNLIKEESKSGSTQPRK